METNKKNNTESVTLFFSKTDTENFTYDGKILEFILIDDNITVENFKKAEIYFSATDINNIIFFVVDIGDKIDLKFLMPINISAYTEGIAEKIIEQNELEFRLTLLNSDYQYISERNAPLSIENSLQIKNIFLRQMEHMMSFAKFENIALKTMNEQEYEIMMTPFMREIFYGNKEEKHEA